MPSLLSVNVGMPQNVDWQGRTVFTSVWKTAVQGPRIVRHLNIDGDGQGDLAGHGGEHRAVFVYQIDSYHYWQRELGRDDYTYGQFGENFTIDGLSDQDVCIGDRYRIGGAVFEVTQPRVTCYRVGIRMNEPRMAALLVAHNRPGFYFRVVEEGEVEAGHEIVQIAKGPELMSVSDINALLYKPGHPRDQLARALRIPALSAGWRGSFQKMLDQGEIGATGNAGLGPASSPPPAWTGFRQLRVSRKMRESSNVVSLELKPVDGLPLAAANPGQFVVLRLTPAPNAPAILRSYSLSAEPDTHRYRISVKQEPHGVAGAYIDATVNIGDVLDVSAPRGNFTLRTGTAPVVLLSAGIGATPVMAMLHALAAEGSKREVWWIHVARNGREHAFAGEAKTLIKALAHGHSHIRYSVPDPEDQIGVVFDALGRLTTAMLEGLGVPRDADFFICGPSAFMSDLSAGLAAWGVATKRIHTELFGAGSSSTPGIAAAPQQPPHPPIGPEGAGPLVSFARSGLNVHWDPKFQSLLEFAEACDVPVRWSCRTGVCHNCESGLVAGSVAYSPEPIDAPAQGNVLICCSRPEGDVVIDL